ncbi:MAG: archease [Calditrichaeota bacterium]|nr:archease [Calditrichota bacterium]
MKNTIPRYQFFEHTGDMGLEVLASSLNELFEWAARGLTAVLTEPETVQPKAERNFSLRADQLDELLIRWLNRLNFEFETEGWLFAEFRVQVKEDFSLHAAARGEPFDPQRHEILREIKAATYHQLVVEKRDGVWYARIIFDL